MREIEKRHGSESQFGPVRNATAGTFNFFRSFLTQVNGGKQAFPKSISADKLGLMPALLTIKAIETPHLVLREMERSDSDELAAFMTQPRYQRHITHRMRDGAMVQDFVRRQIAARGDSRRHVYHLVAEEKLSSDVVGDGFVIVHGDGSHELGWGVHPAMWSMGLGTEIGRGLLAISFENLGAKTAWSKVMTANAASAKLAKRIGMCLTASHTDYPLGQGKFGQVDIFGMTTAEYYDLPY